MESLTDPDALIWKSGGGSSSWGRSCTFLCQVLVEHPRGHVLEADENVVQPQGVP